MNDDILDILERSASEIRDLRSQAVANRLMMQNLTIRLALHQLRHGMIDYQWHAGNSGLWDKLLALIESNRLMVSSSGEIYLDRKELTHGLLNDTDINK